MAGMLNSILTEELTEKYALSLGKNLEETQDSLPAFVNENIRSCKLTRELWYTVIPTSDAVCPKTGLHGLF